MFYDLSVTRAFVTTFAPLWFFSSKGPVKYFPQSWQFLKSCFVMFQQHRLLNFLVKAKKLKVFKAEIQEVLVHKLKKSEIGNFRVNFGSEVQISHENRYFLRKSLWKTQRIFQNSILFVHSLSNQKGSNRKKLHERNNAAWVTIWAKGVVWRWKSGGFKAPPQKKNYVIKFQKHPRGRTAFLLDKFAGPLTPDFFTTKSSLYWVIWTSRHGYIFSAIFLFTPVGWRVHCTIQLPLWT